MKYYIFIGISITVFIMGVIVYPTIHTVNFDDYSSHDIPTALANIPQISSEGQNLKFIDFSYTHTVGEPIQFILEKARDRDCNSYDAKITDKDGNFIWSAGAEISCDSASIFNPIPIQTEIGYRENKPIIINESGKYYLEVEFIDAFTKREFVVRQNHGGGTLDTTVYPVPFDMPSPHKQMELGIKLGHIICDKDKVPVWNTHYKPACVFSDTELELVKRGWAKLRLMLPASPFPEKEMEWTGRNIMSMMLEGTFSYSSTPVETLEEKRKAIEEYSEQYHQGEEYLEYAITPHQYQYNVGDKVQFELLEWGKTSDCSNLQLRIIDTYDQSVFEHITITGCVGTDTPRVIFNSYSMGDDSEEFVCDKSGYYRIEVSNEDVFPPTILQNFACLDSEPIPDGVVKHNSIPSAQEFLQMDCEDLNHLYPEFPNEDVADAWITRMHECLNEQEPRPEPERTSDTEMQLRNAKKSLQNAYHNHMNLGPYYMKDVVVGFGTYDDTLIVDIASKYTDSDSFQTVKKEIQHIVGKDINVDYVVYDEPIERHIATAIPYLWNKILHQNNIGFYPKNQTYWNHADGFADPDKVCSPLVFSNGTEFFISSTFNLEPFEITGTYIDKTEPDDCHKIWKTDVLMAEPDRVTALWLENED